MRLNELFDYDADGDGDIDYVDDIIVYMRHDDNFYNHFYYPAVLKLNNIKKQGKKISPKNLIPLVNKAVIRYLQKFDISDVEITTEEKTNIANLIFMHEKENISNGIYN